MNAQRMKGGRAIGVCARQEYQQIDREAAGAAHDVRNRPIVRMCYGSPDLAELFALPNYTNLDLALVLQRDDMMQFIDVSAL